MKTNLRRARLTLEIEFPEPVPRLETREGVAGLLITWQRGPAVDSSLSWHWFPVTASAQPVYGATGPMPSWTGGTLGRDGSAPEWVREAVAAHRPADDDDETRVRLEALVRYRESQDIGDDERQLLRRVRTAMTRTLQP